jgi:MFS family permease
VLAPVLGYAVDRWGHRFHYVALAPLLWITSCSLIGYSDAHPLVPLVFASLAGVINGAPLREWQRRLRPPVVGVVA